MANLKKQDAASQSKWLKGIVDQNLCTACGACVGLDHTRGSKIEFSMAHVSPSIADDYTSDIEPSNFCPGPGYDYLNLQNQVFGQPPTDWRLGHSCSVRIGHAINEKVRENSASGGVLTTVLCHLIEAARVDAVIVASQGTPKAEFASPIVTSDTRVVQNCAQSIYISVPMLMILSDLDETKRYAITCLPDQAATLRRLQLLKHPKALAIKFILGPYTGTALEPGAIQAYLKMNGAAGEPVSKLNWRAGEWPGNLRISLVSGRILETPKIYYNYLIPFFISRNSLFSMDFANEFTDLSVGDAWSPKYEKLGKGFSVVVSRSTEMEAILKELMDLKKVSMSDIDPLIASEMHGHMIDFKKRGGFIRQRLWSLLGSRTPNFSVKPSEIPTSRIFVELIISSLFLLARTRVARGILTLIPEKGLGQVFNRMRLTWKAISKPTKRKGLRNLRMVRRG